MYTNQDHIDTYDKKTYKKTLELGKHTRWRGGPQSTKKKKVSVGVDSTLRHPLAKASLAGLTDYVTRHNS
jgi:hypothetical protein